MGATRFLVFDIVIGISKIFWRGRGCQISLLGWWDRILAVEIVKKSLTVQEIGGGTQTVTARGILPLWQRGFFRHAQATPSIEASVTKSLHWKKCDATLYRRGSLTEKHLCQRGRIPLAVTVRVPLCQRGRIVAFCCAGLFGQEGIFSKSRSW